MCARSGDFTLVDDKLFMRVAGVTKNRDGYVDRMDYGCTHPGSRRPDAQAVATVAASARWAACRTPPAASTLRWLASDSVEVNVIGDVTNDSSEAGADVLRRVRSRRCRATDPRYVWVDDGNPTTVPTIPLRLPLRAYGQYSCDPNRAERSVPELRDLRRLDRAHHRSGRSSPWSCRSVQQLDQYGLSANLDWTINDDFSLKSIRPGASTIELGAGRRRLAGGQPAAAADADALGLEPGAAPQRLRSATVRLHRRRRTTSSRTARSRRAWI